MPELASKDKCTGCAACYNKCVYGAIHMDEDNKGFLFPTIDADKCINCKACEKACPVIEKVEVNSTNPKAFIAQHKDGAVRKESTSGGAFTAIASAVIDKGGVVFGASFVEGYRVGHIYVEKNEDLSKFRNSKYVQSEIGDSYIKAKEYLENGTYVCFSGTPCQIQGLKKYLGKAYENLVTVDFMCHSVPSPKIFHKYIVNQKIKYPTMDKVVFRDKSRGYSYSTISLYDVNGIALYRGGTEYDQWMRLFMEGYCNRDSCYECRFQTGYRASDFTLWDCWAPQHYNVGFDDKGTTNIIVWTDKGKSIIDKLPTLRLNEIGIDNIDASLERSSMPRPKINENEFWDDSDKMETDEFLEKYVPISNKIKWKSNFRYVLWKLHLHDVVRKTVHTVRRIKK
jgi:coenzyme F420-reducing hydrogenase beta subunit